MLDENIVKDKLHERGFTINAYGRDAGDRTITIYAITDPRNEYSYGCTVHLKTEEFELNYAVPKSINVLQTPKCGSFLNDDHFMRILRKFEPQVEVLHRAFGDKE